MGRLYEACQKVAQHIDANYSGAEVFRMRGALAMKTGYIITLVEPDEPDDAVKLSELREAAKEVLGLDIGV